MVALQLAFGNEQDPGSCHIAHFHGRNRQRYTSRRFFSCRRDPRPGLAPARAGRYADLHSSFQSSIAIDTMNASRQKSVALLAVEQGLLLEARLHEALSRHGDDPLLDWLVRQGWLNSEHLAQMEQLLDQATVITPTPHGPLDTSSAGDEAARTARTMLALLRAPAESLTRRGRYLLEEDEPSGHGGMGQVWRAHDDRLGRTVALKEMHPHLLAHDELKRRFLVEAQVTSQLQHPGIVPVYEMADNGDGTTPFYTMRFVEGRTLSEAARQHAEKRRRGQSSPLELRALLSAFVAVCNTLAYAHARGVIHRDLKGGNVVLGEFGEVVVLDWGLARVLHGQADERAGPAVWLNEELQSQPGVKGTVAYMAPEQARGETDRVDRRSDVFGLGAILYEILSGSPPHAGGNKEEMLRQAEAGQVIPLRSRAAWVPRPLAAVCMKALAARPDERYQNAEELGAEVNRWLSGEPVAAWPEPLLVRAGRWVRRHQVLAAAAAAALLMALVLGSTGAVWWQQRMERERLAQIERQKRFAEQGEATIDQAAQMRKRMLWQEARRLLEQAGEAVREADDEGLRARFRQAEADLTLVEKLDRVREAAQALVEGKWDPGSVRDRYLRVFKEHGLDVFEDSVEALARRIGASAVREEILAALDDWSLHAADPDVRRRWSQLTARLDPGNRWRKVLLEKRGRRDPAQRRALLAQLKHESMAPATAVFLSFVLGKRTPESLELLARARERKPDDFWLNFSLGNGMGIDKDNYREERDRSRQEEAIGYFRAALAVKPTSSVAHYNLGVALKAKGDREGAIRCYREAIRISPTDAWAHTNLGVALYTKADLEGAIRSLCEAIRLDPKLAPAHSHLGVTLHAKGDVEGAIHSWRAAIRLDPTTAVVHTNLGVVLCDRGRLVDAIRSYREAIRFDPRFAKAHTGLGVALKATGDVEGAIGSWREAIRLDPANVEAHNNLGIALHAKGDLKGAIRALREAIRLDPKYARAHTNLGGALRDAGDVEGAIDSHRQAIRLDPKFTGAYYNLGLALQDKGDVKGAIHTYREALAIDPTDATTHSNLGNALRINGEIEGAIRCHLEAIRLDPRFAGAHNNLGLALHAKGDVQGAIRSWHEAIRLDPKLTKAHNNLGAALHGKGDIEGAIRNFREALRLDPRYPNAHAGLGLSLLSCGDFAAARTSFEQAAKLLLPTDPLSRAVGDQLARCCVLLDQERTLHAVLAGKHTPKDAAERMALAAIAMLPAKQLYASAARLCTEALQAQPALTSDLRPGHRYNAACAATRAGTGQGMDTDTLDDTQRAEMRYRALCWLQDDLAAHTRALSRSWAIWGKPSYQALMHWRRDADLAAVRDPGELGKLPEAEQVAWLGLWAQVDSLLAATRHRPQGR
jgi:tetratricopeptide (TPR) repeat protein/tRNA A-37 threonylcarbamoyl transferase component Bud32